MSMGPIRRAATVAILTLSGALGARGAEPPSVEAFGNLPFLRSARMSPDGTMVAAIVPASNGQESLVVLHLGSKDPTIIPVDGYLPNWFKWKGNGRIIASVHRTAFARSLKVLTVETRIFAVNPDGSNSIEIGRGKERRFVTKGHRQIEDDIVDLLPDDPKHLLLALGGHDGLNVEQVDVETGAGNVVEYGKHDIGYWVTDHSGAARAGSGLYINDQFTYVRATGTDDWRKIDNQDVTFGTPIWPIAFADNPDILYVYAPSASGFWGVVEYDTANAAFGRVVASRPDRDVEYVIRDRRLVGYIAPSDRQGYEKTFYLDPTWEHDAESINHALPDTLNLIVDKSTDAKRLLIFARGLQEPGAYYILDRTGPKPTMTLIGDRYPNIYPEEVQAPREVSYTARDGLAIHGYLVLPKGKKGTPVPFVILPHGGPKAYDSGYFDYLAQFLVSRGYGVFQPNFRGSAGYGAKFQQAGIQQWGLAIQDDVTDGTKWLIDQKLADPQRIAIMGGGFGGYVALMGAATQPDLYRCAISLGGLSNLPDYAFYHHYFGGHFATLPQFNNGKLADTSPANLADRIKVPILLAHGRLDWHIPVDQTESMESALRRAGKNVQALYFDDDDGNIVNDQPGEVEGAFDLNDLLLATSPARTAFLKAAEKFLNDNLGPGVN